MSVAYDPFAGGAHPVGTRSFTAPDPARARTFPCEAWYPALASGGRDAAPDARRPHALAVYSHSSGGDRRSATFLCTHLASHGYVVAAMDHSEIAAPELGRRDGETEADRAARVDAVIASRVPDVRLLLDLLLSPRGPVADLGIDPSRIALIGHSFGGWTVLAVPEVDPRPGAVVAMAPGGIAHPRPGILRLALTFAWQREVPTLYLAADLDVPIPLTELSALVRRAPAPKRMVVLRRADHQHFVDDVAGDHEAVRSMELPPEAAWLSAEMLPASRLQGADAAHAFSRGLTLAHLDAALRGSAEAAALLDGDVEATLAAHGVDGSQVSASTIGGAATSR